MLAKFVFSGNCWEHAAVGLTEFFSPDFKGRAELLQLKSKQDVNSHCILVLNRDPKTNLNDPEKWNKESIILDGWKKRMLDFNKESVSMLEIDDLNGKKEDLYFESHIVIDQPLSLVDIDKIIVLLETFNEFVCIGGMDLFFMIANDKMVGCKEVSKNSEKFINDFQTLIRQEIQHYQKLKTSTVAEIEHAKSTPAFEKYVEIPSLRLFKQPIEEIELKKMSSPLIRIRASALTN